MYLIAAVCVCVCVCLCVWETDNCVNVLRVFKCVFTHMEPEIYDQREDKEQFCTVAHKHTNADTHTLLHRSEVSFCLWQCPETFNYSHILNVIITIIINNNILTYVGQYSIHWTDCVCVTEPVKCVMVSLCLLLASFFDPVGLPSVLSVSSAGPHVHQHRVQTRTDHRSVWLDSEGKFLSYGSPPIRSCSEPP